MVGFTGIERYVIRLWDELEDRTSLEICAFALGRVRGGSDRAIRRLPVPLRVIYPVWRVFGWPRAETLTGSVDVVHSIDMLPPPTRSKLVVTINDVMPVTHAEFYSSESAAVQRKKFEASKRADVVITTCEATADEIVEVLGISRERIAVAPLGPMEIEPSGAPTGIMGPYILAVGAITPRKGFETLARAAAMLGSECPTVVIAGPDGWRANDVRKAIAGVGLERFCFVGPVSDQELANLFANATIACHPSVAEGFGLTCLEAMRFGSPVVAADIPSVREIAAGTALLVPVGDAEAMAGALRSLLDNDELRTKLSVKGRVRSEAFSWRRMADGVVQAYQRAVA